MGVRERDRKKDIKRGKVKKERGKTDRGWTKGKNHRERKRDNVGDRETSMGESHKEKR